MNQLRAYLKLIIRERYWCRLLDTASDIAVEFGYDLYVYINCPPVDKEVIDRVRETGIYIENI